MQPSLSCLQPIISASRRGRGLSPQCEIDNFRIFLADIGKQGSFTIFAYRMILNSVLLNTGHTDSAKYFFEFYSVDHKTTLLSLARDAIRHSPSNSYGSVSFRKKRFDIFDVIFGTGIFHQQPVTITF